MQEQDIVVPVDDERLLIETKIKGFLQESPLPRSMIWLKFHIGYPLAYQTANALVRLERARWASYAGCSRWERHREPARISGTEKEAFDPMILVGPVWEPRVADALRSRGLEIVQQRHVLSFYLDISIEAKNGGKLDIEVDGRCHRLSNGRRKPSDLARDALLRANGWTICRVWVRDLIADFDGQISWILDKWRAVSEQIG